MIDLFIPIFALISIMSFYGAIAYIDPEHPIFYKLLGIINGIGFGLGAISGYTKWF